MSPRHKASAGFTLLELMTAITIVAILLGIGVPAFQDTIRTNRLTTHVNELVTALNVARSEASKRGIAVSVCASNADQNGCSGGASWSNGWIVFTDDVGTAGTVDGGDEIVQVFNAPATGYTVDATAPTTMSYIRFMRSGSPDSVLPARTMKLSMPSCSGNKARQITVGNTGRISSGKIAC